MKSFDDHFHNLLKNHGPDIDNIKGTIKIIYEMIQYELEGDSHFLEKLKRELRKALATNKVIDKICMNFSTFSLFRNERHIDSFNPETRKEVLQTGKYANFWGFDIYINNSLKYLEFKIVLTDEDNKKSDFEREVLIHI